MLPPRGHQQPGEGAGGDAAETVVLGRDGPNVGTGTRASRQHRDNDSGAARALPTSSGKLPRVLDPVALPPLPGASPAASDSRDQARASIRSVAGLALGG